MTQAEQQRAQMWDRIALGICSVVLVAWIVVGIWRA
jgi:hypothetical protein